jgi:hypothetical protein
VVGPQGEPGPQEVVRTAWVTALYAAGADATPPRSTRARCGRGDGELAEGEIDPSIDLDRFFEENGPKWHVSQGRLLDIPVLFGQGATDNLFNLNQGLANFDPCPDAGGAGPEHLHLLQRRARAAQRAPRRRPGIR